MEFPFLELEDAEEILAEAARTVQERFGVPVEFDIEWMSSMDEMHEAFYEALEDTGNWDRMGERIALLADSSADLSGYEDTMAGYLKSIYSLRALINFLPATERAAVRDYRDFVRKMVPIWRSKVRLWLNVFPDNPRRMVNPEKMWQHSSSFWSTVVPHHPDIDVYLTNVLVIYDWLEWPHPHAIFYQAKFGGVGYGMWMGDTDHRGAVFTSAFGILTTRPEFGAGDYQSISRSGRNKILGAVLVAHEFGHTFFGMPEFYEGHDSRCMMSSPSVPAHGYVTWYDDLIRSPGRCSACEPYLLSARCAMEGGRLRKAGDFQGAKRMLRESLRLMPKDVQPRDDRKGWIKYNLRLANQKDRFTDPPALEHSR